MKYVVVLMLLMILASLGSGLYYVMRDEPGSKRALKALALRVGLSLALFLLLMAGYWLGFIPDRPAL